jgi:hypothetical protein
MSSRCLFFIASRKRNGKATSFEHLVLLALAGLSE